MRRQQLPWPLRRHGTTSILMQLEPLAERWFDGPMLALRSLRKTVLRALMVASLPMALATCGTQRTAPDANDLYYCSVRLGKEGYKLEVEALKAKGAIP